MAPASSRQTTARQTADSEIKTVRTVESQAGRQVFTFRRVLAVIVLALSAAVYLVLSGVGSQRSLGPIGPMSLQRRVEVEVLNGSGASKAAQRVTDYLRQEGFDVVDVGNFTGKELDQTVVLDRSGSLETARRVALSLGIPQERASSRVDRKLFLDVTVIIGKDYASLQPYR